MARAAPTHPRRRSGAGSVGSLNLINPEIRPGGLPQGVARLIRLWGGLHRSVRVAEEGEGGPEVRMGER